MDHFPKMMIWIVALLCLLPSSLSLAFPAQDAGAVAERVDSLEKGIVPLRRKSASIPKRHLGKRLGQNVGLNLADGNQEFVAQVTIGTPWTSLQTFELPIDTASSDTWIAGIDFTCEDYMDNCTPGPQFSPSASFVPLNASLIDSYGIGSVTGDFGTDTVTIGSKFHAHHV
jgi:hypothetical protein